MPTIAPAAWRAGRRVCGLGCLAGWPATTPGFRSRRSSSGWSTGFASAGRSRTKNAAILALFGLPFCYVAFLLAFVFDRTIHLVFWHRSGAEIVFVAHAGRRDCSAVLRVRSDRGGQRVHSPSHRRAAERAAGGSSWRWRNRSWRARFAWQSWRRCACG